MKVECLSSFDDLEEFCPEWDSLASAVDVRHPFIELDWLRVWSRHLQGGALPYVLSARDGGKCLGVWPLVLEQSPWLFQARILTFPGRDLADYQGLALGSDKSRVVDRFVDFLVQRRDWDLLWLSNIADDDPASRLIIESFREHGLRVDVVPSLRCPYLAVSGEWSDFYRSIRSSGARKNLARSLRRLSERGELEFKHYTSKSEVTAAIEDTFRLHEARWFDRFTTTPYSREIGKAFFADLAQTYAEHGLLDLGTLELDGKPIAFSFSFSYPNRYFYYVPAFDPQFAPYSPGTLLMIHLIERAFDEDVPTFDFMLGDEAYKWQWTSSFRANVGIVVANRTVRGRVGRHTLSNYRRVRNTARRSEYVRWVRREGLGRFLGAAKRIRRR